MKLSGSCKYTDVNHGMTAYRNTPCAVLLDVRSFQEYRQGHIPGSQNLPLQFLEEVDTVADDKDIPIFIYCRSGSRSYQAVSQLLDMGYSNVTNIGGIVGYTGKIEVC